MSKIKHNEWKSTGLRKNVFQPRLIGLLLFLILSDSNIALASAISYNITVDDSAGGRILTGMFDSTATTSWDETNITNWMFTIATLRAFPGPILLGSALGHTLTDFAATPTTLPNLLVTRSDTTTLLWEPRLIAGGYPKILIIDSELNISKSTTVGLVTGGPKHTNPIPEPSTAILLLTGLAGLAGYRWSQRRREWSQIG